MNKPQRKQPAKVVRLAQARLATLATMHTQAGEAIGTFATLEALERAGAPNPFDLLTPTRNNFANIPDALAYYKARLAVCRKADEMLNQAASVCRSVCESTDKAIAQLSKLTAADLVTLNVLRELQPAELQAFTDRMRPMIKVFSESARAYAERGELLQKTIDALARKQAGERS